MNVRFIRLADGRYVIFYEFSGANWTEVAGIQPDPRNTRRIGDNYSSESRWNPLLGEWLVTATHRQDRTFLPPASFCPFCPSAGTAGEIAGANYDLAVLENRFPSLQPAPGDPSIQGNDLYPVAPALGVCEVVLYSSDHSMSLAQASLEQIYKLVLVWTSRFVELSRLEFVKYVFIFENKGEAIGVTLHHPHGQIYAYPFTPPRVQTELQSCKAHKEKTGACLLCDILTEETRDGRRLVAENESFVAFIPFFARWPYEVHIIARRHVQSLEDFTLDEQQDFAAMLKAILVAYDRLFSISFPYIMAMHQRPCDGGLYEYYHFHVEFYPPLRTATKLKYLAGSETGAGMFINDTLPEAKAQELRSKIVPVHLTGSRLRS
jgi:UDPglucose--hexose-1-phosphate uridylyltransferase